jgi:NAD(P)-dependent dehydrogenase (short-subunit alcohol dehydrogenase family)
MVEDKPLRGKVALVTGASRGVGKAIAVELADLGADIAVTARTVTPRSDIAGTIGQTVSDLEARGATAISIQADLLDPADVSRMVEQTFGRFGGLDILINNAAFIGDEVFQSFWEMSAESWREQFDLNVNSQFALMKHFAPSMRERGGGLIINLGSNDGNVPVGHLPLPRQGGLGASYPTTKAAIVHMSKWVGNELRGDRIAVVCLSPGYARSESAELLSSKMGIDVNNAQPVEVAARAVGYLATCDDPLQYAGRFLQSADFLAEVGLAVPAAG